ncbi:hypothetical protein K4K61_002376 [Colletotrichum sp. SAR11_59]|nr:hypothetical protein K4K61_002376 [Colletotrichum sp. SAR11_59]
MISSMAAPSAAGVLGCLFTLLGLSGLLILARLWLRLQIQSQPLALSDGLLVIAWFSCLAQAVLVILMRNEDVLHPDINYTLFNWEADPAKLEHVRKLFLCWPIERNWSFSSDPSGLCSIQIMTTIFHVSTGYAILHS